MPINLNEHKFYEERILVSKKLMGLANIQQARSVTGVVQVDKMDNPTGFFIRTLNLVALNITRSMFEFVEKFTNILRSLMDKIMGLVMQKIVDSQPFQQPRSATNL